MKRSSYLNNKSILVTGGTGTFGRAFVKRLLDEYDPREIVIFSRDEFKQFEMVTIPSLPDAADWERLNDARQRLQPNLSHKEPAARYAEAKAA